MALERNGTNKNDIQFDVDKIVGLFLEFFCLRNLIL